MGALTTLDRLRTAIATTLDDPVKFEALVFDLVAARDGRHLSDPGFRDLVRNATLAVRSAESVAESDLHKLVAASAAPTLAVSPGGSIVATNEAARAAFSLEADEGLAAIGISRSAFERFLARANEHGDAGSMLLADPKVAGGVRLLRGAALPGRDIILLRAVEPDWSAHLDSILAEEFGLSAREVEVLQRLSQGNSINEIAVRDRRAVGTIRQSVKAILAKLGVGSQAQAVALVAALRAASSDHPVSTAATLPVRQAQQPSRTAMRDRLGRTIGLREFGATDGAAVLFVHGALYGIGELGAECRLASSLGLRVIACERPGYGRTPPCSVTKDPLDSAVNDMAAALERYDIESVVVVAHDTGFAHACAFAAEHGARVTAIIGVSPAIPMVSREQIRSMPPQQQIIAWAAREAPWLADFLTRVGVERMRRLGPAGWPQAVFGGVDVDLNIARDPEILPAVVRAYEFNAAQNALGFRFDVTTANADWSAQLAQVDCPMRLIHGSASRTIPLASVVRFVKSRKNTTLDVVEGAGHTLAMSHPHLGLRAAYAMSLTAGQQ